uniref:Uncharacterized protein n=1 Tax=Trypanosoma vivax (strain Y486) TaxID=1055687 RepID=G0U032_TRYVY|nr:hypothetical protein TVY486_0800370 [Trypanosoma vivax Y486]
MSMCCHLALKTFPSFNSPLGHPKQTRGEERTLLYSLLGTYIYIYIYICICVCVHVYICASHSTVYFARSFNQNKQTNALTFSPPRPPSTAAEHWCVKFGEVLGNKINQGTRFEVFKVGGGEKECGWWKSATAAAFSA